MTQRRFHVITTEDLLITAHRPLPERGEASFEAIRKIKEELGVNQTLGASNISFGLPDRALVNHTFLALAIWSGVTCPTVDVARVRPAVLSIDLILGRDRFAQRYIREFRQRKI